MLENNYIMEALLNGNTFVNLTESLEYEKSGVFYKVVQTGDQKEVIVQNGGALSKLLLSAIEVKVNVKTFHEFSDWIPICVGLLLYDSNQIFHILSSLAMSYDSSG